LQVNISIGACEITPTIDFDEALLKIEQILAEVKRSGNGEILILS